mmetsp:Transcript_21381/g.48338  ORF Transcript_21381/g.48338 Transcript_21381/m.48338 type:complete len:119 (+) Transcript_21381:2231-2587(+)
MFHGEISHNRKGRAMAVGTVVTTDSRQSKSMQVHGRCSIIRANIIALCLLLQQLVEQKQVLNRGTTIIVYFQTTRVQRYLNNTLRLDTMRYEDELSQDMAERVQALLMGIQNQLLQEA